MEKKVETTVSGIKSLGFRVSIDWVEHVYGPTLNPKP